VLSNCASLVAKQPTIFVPYLKEFFVRLGTLAHATAFAFARADASTRFSARSAAVPQGQTRTSIRCSSSKSSRI
jgi:hypothetical protein